MSNRVQAGIVLETAVNNYCRTGRTGNKEKSYRVSRWRKTNRNSNINAESHQHEISHDLDLQNP